MHRTERERDAGHVALHHHQEQKEHPRQDGTQYEHQKNIRKTSKKHQKNTNKNDKNDKELKKNEKEGVGTAPVRELTDQELRELGYE